MSAPIPGQDEDKAPMLAESSSTLAYAYEAEHVHSVYDQIAEHFSETRYKPWPIVSSFLKSRPSGSVGLDVGCGNGKYLSENEGVFLIGSDMSEPLLQLAAKNSATATSTMSKTILSTTSQTDSNGVTKSQSKTSLLLASTLALPHPASKFDFAISIAVIHHLSTRERRIEAVKEILRCLVRCQSNSSVHKGQADTNGESDVNISIRKDQSPGQALLYVWALEQKSSRRGWDEGHEQDVMVPWVLQKKNEKKTKGKEKDHLLTTVTAEPSKSDQQVPAVHGGDEDNARDGYTRDKQQQQPKVYNRYYHLYRKGELEEDVISAGGRVLSAGYEKDNWWVICCRCS